MSLPDVSVRMYNGVPPLSAFASNKGSPLIIDVNTGFIYFVTNISGSDVVTQAGGGGGGSGTVTSVSVATANGFAGTVATPTVTPVITITTTVTGLLKGNGTAISAAVPDTDFQNPLILTTTGTGGPATLIADVLNIPSRGTSITRGKVQALIQLQTTL